MHMLKEQPNQVSSLKSLMFIEFCFPLVCSTECHGSALYLSILRTYVIHGICMLLLWWRSSVIVDKFKSFSLWILISLLGVLTLNKYFSLWKNRLQDIYFFNLTIKDLSFYWPLFPLNPLPPWAVVTQNLIRGITVDWLHAH